MAINNEIKDKKVTYKTDLPDGEYCNVYAAGDCSQIVKVEGGQVKTTIPLREAVALYVGATPASHPNGAATNPSDPVYGEEKAEDTLPPDPQVTVYFKPDKGYGKGRYKLHYQKPDGAWTDNFGEKMDKACKGWWKRTITSEGLEFPMVINDGDNHWYNKDNEGGANYDIPPRTDTYITQNYQGHPGVNPCPVKSRTAKVSHAATT